VDLWTKYRAAGGKLGIGVAQCHEACDRMEAEIDHALKGAARGLNPCGQSANRRKNLALDGRPWDIINRVMGAAAGLRLPHLGCW
jgi:hypothetical protein